jgi:hypothetical protein
MAYKIIVKKRFTNKAVKLLNYLETEWNEKVAQDFIKKMDKQIERISEHPFSGLQLKTSPMFVQCLLPNTIACTIA